MSDEDDRDSASGFRPRRATGGAKRRSLRVPVDEVPRRSSPALTRPSFDNVPKVDRMQTERNLPRVVPPEPLPALRTDPGVNVELADEDIEVEESREMETVASLDAAVEAEAVSVAASGLAARVDAQLAAPSATLSSEESDAEMVIASAELDAGAFGDLSGEPAIGIGTQTSPEGEPAPLRNDAVTAHHAPEIEPEATQVSAPPLRPSLEIVDRPTTEMKRAQEPPPSPSPSVRPPPAEPRVSSPDAPRTSQPVVVAPVVVVSRAITVVGSPSSAPPPPAAAPPAAPPKAAEAKPVPREADLPSVMIDSDADSLELDVEVSSGKEASADDDVEPLRVSQVPELAESDEELAADELLEDAPPPPKTPRSSPPPRPERAMTSGPPPTGPAIPHLPPPPPVPSIGGAHTTGQHVSPYASAAAAAAPVITAAAPAAAPPTPPSVVHTDPPTDPRRGKKKGAWWEDLFNDDYLRTVPAPHPKQVMRQCDFIEARLGLVRGATLLDVGCGLGLHAIELTRRGYLVVGLDLSLPMLSRAADEAQDQGYKINFLHADMREMNFDGAFDAVLSWGTSFGYFDDDVNRGVLERIHRALKPGGLFLLDLVNRDYVVRTQPNNVWFEGDGCVVMEETQCNYISSRLHVKRTVMLDDGRQRESAYSIRLYSLHELGQMLHKSFRVVEVSGREATPGVFFGADSPRLLVVAERRVAAPPGPPAPPKKSEGDPSISSSMPAVSGLPPAQPAVPPDTEHN